MERRGGGSRGGKLFLVIAYNTYLYPPICIVVVQFRSGQVFLQIIKRFFFPFFSIIIHVSRDIIIITSFS